MLSGLKDSVKKVIGKEEVATDLSQRAAHLDLSGSTDYKRLNKYYEISGGLIDEYRFGTTYLARHKASGEIRSIKIIAKKNLPKELFWQEAEMYSNLFHPNVLNLYETLEDRKHYYFVTDRIDRPNIYKAIPKMFADPRDFDEVQIALLVRTILKTLEYCHKKGVAHTDLSYEYILLDPKGKKGFKSLYVCGFGMARLNRDSAGIYEHRSSLRKRSNEESDSDSSSSDEEDDNHRGKESIDMAYKDLFAAPETRWGDLSVWEPPCDIWAVGIITYQLLTRRHPFEDPNVRPINFENEDWKNDHFRENKYWKHVSRRAADFVKTLLTYDFKKRPTAKEAFDHCWLRIADDAGKTAAVKKEAIVDALDNLQNFDAKSKLEKSGRLFIVTNLMQQEQREALDGVFKHLDKDKDNLIKKAELKVALHKAHGKEKIEKIEKMLEDTFERCDIKGDGTIDYSEFLAAAADDSVLLTKENLRATFDAFDKSNTGSITVDDLKDLFNDGRKKKILHKRDAKKIMRQVDLDGDGEISFDEFCDLMRGFDFCSSSRSY